MDIQMIALSRLVPGDGINARKTETSAGVKSLVKSIRALGLLQPLIVRADVSLSGDGIFEVVDGNRRLAALRKVHGKIDAEVPVILRQNLDTDAREASLAANVMRVNLHPVDEFEAFAALAADGMGETDIADHFGIEPQEVRKRLRLAALAPEVRAAWRKGKIDVAQAMAFAASTDMTRQAEVLKAALKGDQWGLSPEQLRRQMVETLVSPKEGVVAFIGGIEAYRAAGGEVEEDLFAGVTLLKDKALVQRLKRDRLEAECRALVDRGWAFAAPAEDVERIGQLPQPDFKLHATPDELAALTSGQYNARITATGIISRRLCADMAFRATAGLIVSMTYEGALALNGPVLSLTPEGRGGAQAGDADELEDADLDDDGTAGDEPEGDVETDPDGPAPAPLEAGPQPLATPATLVEALTTDLSLSVSECLTEDHDLALRILVASLHTLHESRNAIPLRLVMERTRMVGDSKERDDLRRWHSRFAALDGHPTGMLLNALADHVARLLDLRALKLDDRLHAGWDQKMAAGAITAAMPPERLTQAVAARFSPEAHFPRLPAALIDAAVTEMTGRPGKAGRKADKAAFAAGVAVTTGWLPPELRTAHYTGPGSAHWAATQEPEVAHA